MPLWLDMLRTPMAAPETTALRRMRLTWQLLCLALAISIIWHEQLRGAFGRAVPCATAALLVATGLWTLVYLMRKHRADTDYIECRGEGE